MGLNTIKGTGNWGGAASDLNNNFASITAEIEKLKAANVKFKGYYTTELTLKAAHPSPTVGDNAWVGAEYPGTVYDVVNGQWHDTTVAPSVGTVNLSEYAAHGYTSNPKTLKQVDDSLVQLADEKVSSENITHSVFEHVDFSNNNPTLPDGFTIENGSLVFTKADGMSGNIIAIIPFNIPNRWKVGKYISLRGTSVLGTESFITLVFQNSAGVNMTNQTLGAIPKSGSRSIKIVNAYDSSTKQVKLNVSINSTALSTGAKVYLNDVVLTDVAINDFRGLIQVVSNPVIVSEKANHGYESIEVAKTLKQIDDEKADQADLAQLADDVGFQLTQRAVNGDFKNGVDGWTLGTGTSVLNYDNGISLSSDTKEISINNTKNITSDVVIGDKWYFSSLYTSLATLNYIDIHLYNYNRKISTKTEIIGGNRRMSSVIFDITKANHISHFHVLKSLDEDFILNIHSVNLINLTSSFGKGNEPTIEEMDELVKLNINGYIDGVVNSAGWMLTIDKNITANKIQKINNSLISLKQLVANGNFRHGLSSWTSANVAASVNDNVCTLTSTPNRWSEFSTLINREPTDIVYLSVDVKADTDLVLLNSGANTLKNHTGSGQWERLSAIHPLTASGSVYITVKSTPVSYTYQVKNVNAFNLTKIFGKGNEPAVEKMDELVDLINGYIIYEAPLSHLLIYDNMKRIASLESSLPTVDVKPLITISQKIRNGDFSEGKSYWSISGASFSVSEGIASIPTENSTGWVELTKVIPIISGHINYISVEVKTMSNSVSLRSGGVIVEKTKGDGNWHRLSGIQLVGQFEIADNGSSGYGQYEDNNIYVRNANVIDLTEVFGEGNEPTVSDMDTIWEHLPELKYGEDIDISKEFLSILWEELQKNTKSINHYDHQINYHTPTLADNKAHMSIIDDDGHEEVYTWLLPFLKERDIPFGSAISPGFIGAPGYMNIKQLKKVIDEGVEIHSHGIYHESLKVNSSKDALRVDSVMRKSKDMLTLMGYTPHGIVLPTGASNAETLRIAARHYSCTYHYQQSPYHLMTIDNMKNHDIRRYDFDQGFEHAKERIDEAVANNGWLILCTHVNGYWWNNKIEDGDTMSQSFKNLDAIITYAKSLGVDFVLPKVGFQIYGNLLESDNGNRINARCELVTSI